MHNLNLSYPIEEKKKKKKKHFCAAPAKKHVPEEKIAATRMREGSSAPLLKIWTDK